MRVRLMVTGVALVVLVAWTSGTLAQMDPDKVIPGGGIHASGWTGKIDASSAGQGRKLEDAKFDLEANSTFHVTTGPAVTYWNPANRADTNYTVKATFQEPKFMDLNSHPHSYGLFIGGNDMGSDQMTLIYCVTYGTGNVMIRGFGGPSVFTPLGSRPNPAVHKADGKGQPVTQEIQWTVKDGGRRVECSVNGTVIAGYNRDELVMPGKLKSFDGVYGFRMTHNVEAIITGFRMTRN